MSTPANIVINNGTEDRTYVPTHREGSNTIVFIDSDSLTAAGSPVLKATWNPNSGSRGTDRARIQLYLPYEETVDGITVVNHTQRYDSSNVLPTAIPMAEKVKFQNLVANAQDNVLIEGYFKNDPMV